MFHEVLNSIHGDFAPSAYDITGQIHRSDQYSHNHPIVLLAQEELRGLGIYLDHFDRISLLAVWQSDVHFTTKYLATLWWGNVGRNFSRVFTSENMDRLQVFSNDLINALLASTHSPDVEAFLHELGNIIIQMQIHGGTYKISSIGTAFYTKILQFFYASNPIVTNPNYLPVIADQWIMKAVYCEMTDLGDIHQRDDLFKLTGNGMSLRFIPDSYLFFIAYFNNRCQDLGVNAWNMESYLFRSQLVQNHFADIIGDGVIDALAIQRQDVFPHAIRLRVYDGNRVDNYGKSFKIVNNYLTEPHDVRNVFVEFDGTQYPATVGSYRNGDTLRGTRTIQRLIEDNHWWPGQVFRCEFTVADDDSHIYRIIEPIDN